MFKDTREVVDRLKKKNKISSSNPITELKAKMSVTISAN